MGYCPDWYPFFAIAEKCNCKPWELLDVPVWWRNKALKAIAAEEGARKSIQQAKGH